MYWQQALDSLCFIHLYWLLFFMFHSICFTQSDLHFISSSCWA